MKKKISILGCTGSIGDTVFKLIRTKKKGVRILYSFRL